MPIAGSNTDTGGGEQLNRIHFSGSWKVKDRGQLITLPVCAEDYTPRKIDI